MQIDKQLSNNKTLLNLRGSHTEYLNVLQNTTEWEKLRYKKVADSRLPTLPGIFGYSKFEDYWKIVSACLTEKQIINITILNFPRGHKYKSETLT